MPVLRRVDAPSVQKAFNDPRSVEQALASGWEYPEGAAQTVDVVDPTGATRSIPLSTLQNTPSGRYPTAASGERLAQTVENAREQEFSGAVQAGKAILEGGASALSFGGSDWLLDKLGADTAERTRYQAGPRGFGEIGTTIATTILAGGLGGAAKGALGKGLAKATPLGAVAARTGALGTRLGGGIAGTAAAEALEGLATSGGGVISQLALRPENEPLTAEAALTEIGLGTIIGAAAGGAAGGAFKLADKIGSKSAGKGLDLATKEATDFSESVGRSVADLDRAVDDLATVRTPAQAGPITRIKEMPEAYFEGPKNHRLRNLYQSLREADDDIITNDAKALVGLRQYRARMEREFGSFDPAVGTGATKGESAISKTATDTPQLSTKRALELLDGYHERIVATATKTGNNKVVAQLADGAGFDARMLGDTGDDILTQGARRASVDQKVAKFERDIDAKISASNKSALEAEAAGKKPSRLRLPEQPEFTPAGVESTRLRWGMKQFFDDAEPFTAKATAIPDPLDIKALQALRRRVGELDVANVLNGSQEAVLKKLTALSEYADAVEKVSARVAVPGMPEVLKRSLDEPIGKLAGMAGIAPADVDSAYTRLVELNVVPNVRFKGPAAALHKAWVVNQAMSEGSSLAAGVDRALTGRKHPVQRALEAGVYRMGGNVVRKGLAVAGFPSSILALGSGAGARAAADLFHGTIGVGQFLGQVTGGVLNKIATNVRLAGRASRAVGVNMGTVVRNVSFSGDDRERRAEKPRETYDRLSKELYSIAADQELPFKVNEAVSQIRSVAYGVGDKLEVNALNAVQHLVETMPKDPGVLQKWGMSTWKPTDAQVHEWLLRVGATVAPLKVIERFMRGGGSPAEAETLKAVHPETFFEFQKEFLNHLPAIRDKVRFDTRVRLGILFDTPVDSTLRPEFRQFMLAQWEQRASEQETVNPGKGNLKPEQPTTAQQLLA